jgi:hypothetical protein
MLAAAESVEHLPRFSKSTSLFTIFNMEHSWAHLYVHLFRHARIDNLLRRTSSAALWALNLTMPLVVDPAYASMRSHQDSKLNVLFTGRTNKTAAVHIARQRSTTMFFDCGLRQDEMDDERYDEIEDEYDFLKFLGTVL